MSEYQFYEFQAIDKPLTPEQQAQIRKLSSRVKPSSTRAVFTYEWGEFPAQAHQVLERHFDALLYLTNWGTKRLAFRFPRQVVDERQWGPYLLEADGDYGEDGLTIQTHPGTLILNFEYTDEDEREWIEGEGMLDTLVPLREDILGGDYRVLYLGWLLAAWIRGGAARHPADEEWPEDELLEPPVPPGLKQPTLALRAFVKLFGVPPTLVAAAAAASPNLETADEPIEAWVPLLPEAERNAFLARVARGEAGVGVQLLHRLRELGQPQPPAAEASAPRRPFAQLLETARNTERRRAERAAQAQQAARRRYLDELALREAETWQEVVTLIEQKQGRAYDGAVALLVDLHDLAQQRGNLEQFQTLLAELCQRFARSRTLLDRMRTAELF